MSQVKKPGSEANHCTDKDKARDEVLRKRKTNKSNGKKVVTQSKEDHTLFHSRTLPPRSAMQRHQPRRGLPRLPRPSPHKNRRRFRHQLRLQPVQVSSLHTASNNYYHNLNSLLNFCMSSFSQQLMKLN